MITNDLVLERILLLTHRELDEKTLLVIACTHPRRIETLNDGQDPLQFWVVLTEDVSGNQDRR